MSSAPSSSRSVSRIEAFATPAWLLPAWLRTGLGIYSTVLFGDGWLPGLVFLAATLTVPAQGLAGVAGLVGAELWARLLRRGEGRFHGFNGLLTGLVLGAWMPPGLPVWLAMATLLVVLIGSALRNFGDRYVPAPVLCLPFLVVTWVAVRATSGFGGAGSLPPTADVAWMPRLLALYLSSLGVAFLQTSVGAGALVFAGLVLSSRWAAVLSVVGFVAGYATWLALGGTPAALAASHLGVNFALASIALGGVFVVLGPASILLAAASGALSAVLAAAMGPWALAMPFVLVTQLVLWALATRQFGAGEPRLVQGVPASPELNLARTVSAARRYPDPSVPAVFLPVMGRWVVTQGPDGEHTHQGLWAHAWDFEVADDSGAVHRDDGAKIEDFYAWGAPVVAPADGTVVRVVDAVADNPVGEVETKENWGNLVILWHAGGVYSALCHLQRGSVRVVEGQAVLAGQVLGLVGNSGRSPVPHLHFQLQRSAEIGAPTCAGELLHYVSDGTYVTHGVPRSGAVAAVAPDEQVRAALSLAPGRTFRWVLDDGRVETWRSAIDALGRRCLETGDGARAAIFADARYLTVLDYQGGRDRLLGLFALAMARVPFVDDPDLRWHDTPSSTPFVGPLRRVAHELAMPFVEVGTVRTTSRLSRVGPLVQVTTELDGIADRVVVTCAPGQGPVRIVAWRGGAVLVSAEVESCGD